MPSIMATITRLVRSMLDRRAAQLQGSQQEQKQTSSQTIDEPDDGGVATVQEPDIHDAQCRLMFVCPPVATGSWIGGCPSLPEDVDWPQVDGVPAQFIAQISLADVPRETWGGLHPTGGWMVLFAQTDGFGQAVGLHTEALGTPRSPPAAVPDYYSSFHRNVFEKSFGDQAQILPQWPVRIVPSVRRIEAKSGGRVPSPLSDIEPDDPKWQPFDRFSRRGLVASVLDQIAFWLEEMERYAKTEAGGQDDDLEAAITEVRAICDLCESHLSDPTADIPPDVVDRVFSGSVNIVRRGEYTMMPLLGHGAREQYKQMHEVSARRIYLTPQDALPQYLLEAYEPCWAEVAEKELAVLGGPVTYAMPEYALDGAILLELPSSYLVGWMFGDLSALTLSIPPDALAAGRWDQIVVCDDHGL